MRTNVTPDEKPTTELFVLSVIQRTTCKKHGADEAAACFYIPSMTGSFGPFLGVCNKRAKRAGYKHPVSEKSLRINRFKK